MTARPDEVVAWIEVTDTPYGEGLSFSDAANQPRGRYVQETALQSANARLAAVLAECDRLDAKAERERTHSDNCEYAASARALTFSTTRIRRAAAGEGDANQGDSNGRSD